MDEAVDKPGEPLELLQDFDVRYRFLSESEGGRKTGPPLQGYRSDWAYEGDKIDETGMWMIWPFFEDKNGKLLPMGECVPAEGIARMVIVSDALRKEVHCERLVEGTKGYFMEGRRRVAEAEVVRIVGLYSDKQ